MFIRNPRAHAPGGARHVTLYLAFAALLLESGKLPLSHEEAGSYREAAKRLRNACEMALDLTQPVTVEDWVFLEVAKAALAGDLGLLDCVVVKVEAEFESRKQSN